jgi:hypothetical protein
VIFWQQWKSEPQTGAIINDIDRATIHRAQAVKTPIGPLAGRPILLAKDDSSIGFHLKRILEDFGREAVGLLGNLEDVPYSASAELMLRH